MSLWEAQRKWDFPLCVTSPMPVLILEGKSWWELFFSLFSSFLFFFSLLCNCVKFIQKVKSFHFLVKDCSIATGQSQFTWLIDCLFPIVSLVHKRMVLSSIPLRLQMLITTHVQAANLLISRCLWGITYQEGKRALTIWCVSYHASYPIVKCMRHLTFEYFSSQLQSDFHLRNPLLCKVPSITYPGPLWELED